MFIHDALDELITCGNTEIAAHNLNIATHHLGTIAPGKLLSGYEEQFQVLHCTVNNYTWCMTVKSHWQVCMHGIAKILLETFVYKLLIDDTM